MKTPYSAAMPSRTTSNHEIARLSEAKVGTANNGAGSRCPADFSVLSSSQSRYCFCDGLVTAISLTTWLSTEYSVNGWYISSQLCSDQNTSRFGDGFQRFFGELS